MNNEKKIKIGGIFVGVLIFVTLIILTFQFIKIGILKSKEKALQNELTEIQQQTEYFNTQNNYYSTHQDYLEDYAREYLGWGKSDENWNTGI